MKTREAPLLFGSWDLSACCSAIGKSQGRGHSVALGDNLGTLLLSCFGSEPWVGVKSPGYLAEMHMERVMLGLGFKTTMGVEG